MSGWALRRGSALLAIAVAGALLGMGGGLLVQQPEPAVQPAAEETVAPLKRAPVPEVTERLALVWTPGALPQGFGDGVAQLPGVEDVTVVRGGLLELAATVDPHGAPSAVEPDGFVIPLDAIAIDPDRYAPLAPASERKALGVLRPGEALLGSTSATLRDVEPGTRLVFADGNSVTVAGVVADEAVGAAEVVLHQGGSPAPRTERYLLVRYRGERSQMEQAVRALDPSVPVRLREPGETPYLRHGDAVLPQALVKERFGEFAYRRTDGEEVEQDPAWAAEHIVAADVPILGTVRCHRAVMEALEGALRELADRNLGGLVDAAGYGGCHHARLTRSMDAVSRHAWGVALDLNVGDNPLGRASAQDPRLVEVLERWGFTWGGGWLVPDPAHVEYLQAPRP